MKQVLQHLRSGQIEVADVPCPVVRPGHLLVQTTRSLISPGTERTLVEFSQAGLIGKARSQPEKVRQVLNKIRTDGLFPTLEVVFSRLDEPLPLGYCNVGRVVGIGSGVQDFEVGDRVVSNGPHAEMVCVPATLAARVPEGVDDDTAAFTVLGAVALHGIRLAAPTFGEDFTIIGLGLIGQIAAQILRGHGGRVLGVDVNADRCRLAERFGCVICCPATGGNPVKAAEAATRGRGMDGVIIAASADTDDIIRQAARMCRKRGRIVLVGVVGLSLQRAEFYAKELSFQVSCSYGPGRYDANYEEKARDYPLPYVRWTVARNFEAVLEAMSRGTVDVTPLVSRRDDHASAADAYDAVLHDSSTLGAILRYPDVPPPDSHVIRLARPAPASHKPAALTVGLVGTGRFARLVLLPAIRAAGADIRAVVSSGGASGRQAGVKFGAAEVCTDIHDVLASDEINTVFIATPHHLHAAQVADALRAGKHVFVEKPLAIDEEGLRLVREARQAHPGPRLMVGFNRRFAPHTTRVRELLAGRAEPIAAIVTANAGAVPADHSLHDPETGGGRVIGEACHFIDLLMFLVGHPVTSIQATSFGPQAGPVREDKMTIALSFADGSIGALHYLANGPKDFPKERVEIFSEGRALVIDNWRRLRAFGWPAAPAMRMRQDKGHRVEVATFLDRVAKGGEPLIPFTELDAVTCATFGAVRSAREHATIRLAPEP